ncbi:angiomotin-like [Bacillus rossius redtenbacheri]|uniref:angiomotin-like n=1 Tax=Bacillus rossius redtenbacheri TaxID=93214 RepID=UPI002FDEF069
MADRSHRRHPAAQSPASIPDSAPSFLLPTSNCYAVLSDEDSLSQPSSQRSQTARRSRGLSRSREVSSVPVSASDAGHGRCPTRPHLVPPPRHSLSQASGSSPDRCLAGSSSSLDDSEGALSSAVLEGDAAFFMAASSPTVTLTTNTTTTTVCSSRMSAAAMSSRVAPPFASGPASTASDLPGSQILPASNSPYAASRDLVESHGLPGPDLSLPLVMVHSAVPTLLPHMTMPPPAVPSPAPSDAAPAVVAPSLSAPPPSLPSVPGVVMAPPPAPAYPYTNALLAPPAGPMDVVEGRLGKRTGADAWCDDSDEWTLSGSAFGAAAPSLACSQKPPLIVCKGGLSPSAIKDMADLRSMFKA